MYDAIIVGARCAGSPTAMLLARKGYRVLLVDKASFPSDTISTHIIWPHGAEIMDRWGLLDRLAATNCPPIALNMIFDVGPFALKGGVLNTNRGRGGFCPRRTVLDKLLVDAAVDSGAELREKFTVEDLMWDGDRVVGDQGTQPERRQRRRTRTSRDRRRRRAFGRRQGCRGSRIRHDSAARDLLLHATTADSTPRISSSTSATTRAPPVSPPTTARRSSRRSGPATSSRKYAPTSRAHVKKLHESTPSVADRLQSARREEKWVGTAGVANYFRKPYGPGWALVGDAGYQKDPITAQGISDAFIDAEHLVDALDAGFSDRRRSTKRWRRISRAVTSESSPCITSPASWRSWSPRRRRCKRSLARCTGIVRPPTSSTRRLPGRRPLPQFMNPENIGRIVGGAGAASQ